MLFEIVRIQALDRLEGGMYTRSRYERACVWQDYRMSRHTAIYCNVLEHLRILEDLLTWGKWCDDIDLGHPFAERDEELFRYYGLTFLAFEQCVADLRLIRGAINGEQRGRKVEADAEEYMAFINGIWKHRNRARQFHRLCHHGPYLFADAPDSTSALPADGRYLAMGHAPPSALEPPVPVVVPSLEGAMSALARVLVATSRLLRNDVRARHQVDAVYGTVTL